VSAECGSDLHCRTDLSRPVAVSGWLAGTAALIALGLGIASLDRPLAGRRCSVPTATTHDVTGLRCHAARWHRGTVTRCGSMSRRPA